VRGRAHQRALRRRSFSRGPSWRLVVPGLARGFRGTAGGATENGRPSACVLSRFAAGPEGWARAGQQGRFRPGDSWQVALRFVTLPSVWAVDSKVAQTHWRACLDHVQTQLQMLARNPRRPHARLDDSAFSAAISSIVSPRELLVVQTHRRVFTVIAGFYKPRLRRRPSRPPSLDSSKVNRRWRDAVSPMSRQSS